MLTLVIDTSTERGMIAVLNGHDLLSHSELPFGLQNSKHLIPELHSTFRNLKISPKDLNCIGVGIGPGSYTGIRVGVSTAKSLSYACKIPLVGISTLETFIPPTESSFSVMLDAKIGGVYLSKGKEKQHKCLPLVCPIEELHHYMHDVETIITPNLSPLKPKMEKLFAESSWTWIESGPDPLHFGKRVQEKFAKGEYSMDGHLNLLYLRKTQAEIEKGR